MVDSCSGAFQFTGYTFLIRTLLREYIFLRRFIRTERVKALKDAWVLLREESWKIFYARQAEVISDVDGNDKDLLSLLIRGNSKTSAQEKLEDDEMMSQVSASTISISKGWTACGAQLDAILTLS